MRILVTRLFATVIFGVVLPVLALAVTLCFRRVFCTEEEARARKVNGRFALQLVWGCFVLCMCSIVSRELMQSDYFRMRHKFEYSSTHFYLC